LKAQGKAIIQNDGGHNKHNTTRTLSENSILRFFFAGAATVWELGCFTSLEMSLRGFPLEVLARLFPPAIRERASLLLAP
jgi:hypothetical protein